MGQKRLKVGEVREQKDGSFVADINAIDGSLAWRTIVNPKSSAMQHDP